VSKTSFSGSKLCVCMGAQLSSSHGGSPGSATVKTLIVSQGTPAVVQLPVVIPVQLHGSAQGGLEQSVGAVPSQ
jgi:hypothetical protein